MNTEMIWTPAQLCGGFLALCAGVSCVAAAVNWILKGIRQIKAPDRRQDERLKSLEDSSGEVRKILDSDKRRLDQLENGNRVTQRALLALLSHGIDGNAVTAMQKAKTELQEYLIER
jgi:hypothetical protein